MLLGKYLRSLGSASPSIDTTVNVEKEITTFVDAFARADYEIAYASIVSALKANPSYSWRQIVNYHSGTAMHTVMSLKTEKEFGKLLESCYARCPEMITISPVETPEAVQHMLDCRKRNIEEKGLPYFLFIPQGKSGSTSIGNMIGQGFGLMCTTYSFISLSVVPSWARDYARGGSSYVTHLLPTPENLQRLRKSGLKKVVVNTRDPRQIYLSALHHILTYRDNFPDFEKAGHFDLTLMEQARNNLDIFDHAVNWLKAWTDAKDMQVMFTVFWQFLASKEKVLDRLLEFYGADTRHFNREAALSLNEKVDYHLRRGETDEWRSVFDKPLIAYMNSRMPDDWFDRFSWKP